MSENVKIIDADSDNIENFSICGYKHKQQAGYRRKVAWLRDRFREGLRYKILFSEEDADVGFIEYIPAEYAWRGVKAKRFMFIHCIALFKKSYKNKGYGSMLIEECLRDAEKEGMDGVAVVTSKDTWMAGKKLFLKNGFEVADTAQKKFELMVKKFREVDSPEFTHSWDDTENRHKSGLTIIWSDQCPYCIKAVSEITETAKKEFKLSPNIVELKTYEDAQSSPTPYAIFSILLNGKIVADHPISNTRFINIMNKEMI